MTKPGYLIGKFRLRSVVTDSLLPACDALENENFAAALPAFQKEIEQHPDNMAAQIGYIQASRERWPALLGQYRQLAKAHPTGENKFLLGFTAFYVYTAYQYDYSEASADKREALNNLAASNLLEAYIKTHQPVIALGVDAAAHFLNTGNRPSIPEEMLLRMGGQAIHRVYLNARQNHWEGAQPPVPHLSRTDLAVFGYFVRGISRQLSSLSGVEVHQIVNGRNVVKFKMLPRKPDDISGEKYMDAWEASIKAKIDAMPLNG